MDKVGLIDTPQSRGAPMTRRRMSGLSVEHRDACAADADTEAFTAANAAFRAALSNPREKA
jgi:hypothetical protein